ncbi:MAG: GDSL-type esterase/lipase family protein [Verrucomicrobia bacterium]|nr:GDSL-type esterase/lipase family protein [Verrucomicrobiota bacterium]
MKQPDFRRSLLSSGASLVMAAGTLFPASASAQLPLQEGDSICLIGNGLADRMQHDGWVETLIQSKSADRKLTFRNLAFSGDTVTSRPRNSGFAKPEDYLTLCKADVIFVFFGYNESFAGEGGVSKFKQDLGGMIDSYRRMKFNGESAPRFVLFSPSAFEDQKSPNLPSGALTNVNLALYTGAIKQVADEKAVAFVDLFSPSQALYGKSVHPLTLNGVHLLPEGNRQIGEVIATAVTGKPGTASPSLEPLRKAVLDKNWHWHNRYRAVDGNDIWGGRSGLTFVNGQSNREVLEQELAMLDVMTANRDPKIWAVAAGRDYHVDDSNVPAPKEVLTNVGGGNKGPDASKDGSEEYISGQDGIAKLHIPEGFAVNLFADESRFPEMANPVQMQVDAKGRIWAACWNTYPKWEPLKPMTDSLLIFPDDNGDGIADRTIEFAKVHNPLGFEFWNGGVIVTSQPDIIFLKDTDGDDKADVRIVLLQGIGSADTHHSANNLIYGPDGAIYWQSGIFLQNTFEHPWGPALNSTASGMYRFDPRQYAITFHAGNDPNPHGISFDYWGYHFANDGTGGNSFQVRPEGNGFRMHQLLDKQVRPVPADAIVSSANFPDDLQQDFLVLNTIGYLGIKRYELHRDGFPEKGRKLGEVWGTPTDDFVRSDDKNFRPTDAVFGEDGGLYIADWHNIIIGHMQHNIRDPYRDHKHGRIYRMIAKDRPLQKKVAIAGQPIPALLENLKHPIDGVRQRTHVELSGRDTEEVIAATKGWIKQFDPTKEEDAHPLLEALWIHQQHNVRNEALLEAVLNSPAPHARIAAATVKHLWGAADPTKGQMQTKIEGQVTKVEVTVPAHLSEADGKLYTAGAQVFARDGHCITCHQPNGAGLDPTYPPLDGSPWATGNEERLIKLTLHGLWGPLELNGKTYDPSKGVPPMTPFGALLNDEEVAGVLTYVRNSWGNKAAAVQPGSVAKVRAATKDRSIFWSPEELLKAHPMEK